MHTSFYAHRALVRDALLLDDLVRHAHRLQPNQHTMVLRWFRLFRFLFEAHHHNEDDMLFHYMELHMNRPSEQIELLEQDHVRLQFLLDELSRLLRALNRPEAQVDQVQSSAKRYSEQLVACMKQHVELEEQYTREVIDRHMDAFQQKRLEARMRRRASWRYLVYLLPWVSSSLTLQEREALEQFVGLPFRLLSRWYFSKQYSKISEPVYALLGDLEGHPPMDPWQHGSGLMVN